jgi:release factor glutamine methyltransferase
MRQRPPVKHVKPAPPFDRSHADREIEGLARSAEVVVWTDPFGSKFTVPVPPTVYPPREDTNLLAKVVARTFPRPSSTWLEIGCGSGVLTLFAARNGCLVTACDINPFAVAATKRLLASEGGRGEVLEGGPGPSKDGDVSQWGGNRLYDTVVWNMPYLPAPGDEALHLGPMEEAGMIDTGRRSLYDRFLDILANGGLLHATGTAYVVISSLHIGDTACERAWSRGLAARVVESEHFEDGERLFVVQIWRPYAGRSLEVVEELPSTNSTLLATDAPVGTSLRALRQTAGKGQRGRSWASLDNAFMASWKIGEGPVLPQPTWGQVRLGAAMTRLFEYLARPNHSSAVCMKWPNDLYVLAGESGWRKAAGTLMEGVTKGANTAVVVGLGLNTSVPKGVGFGGLDLLGLDLSLFELHNAIHALVASVFEKHGEQACEVEREVVEAEVLRGGYLLGPILYRNKKRSILGLNQEGELVLDGGLTVEDGNLLTWSNI